jgi:hypothetical protein
MANTTLSFRSKQPTRISSSSKGGFKRASLGKASPRLPSKYLCLCLDSFAWHTPSTSTRGIEHESIVRLECHGRLATEITDSTYGSAVGVLDIPDMQVQTALTILSSGESVRLPGSSLGQERDLDVLQELHLSNHTVASAIKSFPA